MFLLFSPLIVPSPGPNSFTHEYVKSPLYFGSGHVLAKIWAVFSGKVISVSPIAATVIAVGQGHKMRVAIFPQYRWDINNQFKGLYFLPSS